MRLRLFVAISTVILSAVAARADTLTTYEVANRSGKASIGTLTVDSTLGTITNLDVTITLGTDQISFNEAPTTQGYSVYTNEYQSTFNDGTDSLLFDLPVTSLVGYTPSSDRQCKTAAYLCDYLANVYTGAPSTSGPVDTFEGNLAPFEAAGVTPEPSSIALLATGLLSAAGLLRRRSV